MKVQFRHTHYSPTSKKRWLRSQRRVRHALQVQFEHAVTVGQVRMYRGTQVPKHTEIKASTMCILRDANDNVVRIGYSFCGPTERFSPSEGCLRSRERAMGILLSAPPAVDDVEVPAGPPRLTAVG